MNTISITADEYPKNLLNIHDPPQKLCVNGKILPQDEKAIAIVGTRRATSYGLDVAKQFAYELASLGITIVSGMALGIDSAAHVGALEAGGRTIAVLGTGIDVIYPPENAKLYDQIIQSGAIVTEYKQGTSPTRWTFPRRNRIIAGLSFGVIVVEGDYKSGAMITAKLALDEGREVFAIPGNINHMQSNGPHWLIKQGAKLIENINDVLEEMVSVLKIPPQISQAGKSLKEKFNTDMLTLEEQFVYKELSFSPMHIDEIAGKTKMNMPQILVLLSQMEIKRFIRQLPGKLFVVN